MPGLDKTGPMGQGAQPGRKLGRCTTANKSTPDTFKPRRWFAIRRGNTTDCGNIALGNRLPGGGLARRWNGRGRNQP